MKMLGSLFSKFFDVVVGLVFLSVLAVFLGFALVVICKGSGKIMKNLSGVVVATMPTKPPTNPATEVGLKKNWYARPENEGVAIVERILDMAKEPSFV